MFQYIDFLTDTLFCFLPRRAYATNMTSVCPSVWNVGGLWSYSATESGNGHMTGRCLATCVWKLSRIVVSCNPKFYRGRPHGVWKIWSFTLLRLVYRAISASAERLFLPLAARFVQFRSRWSIQPPNWWRVVFDHQQPHIDGSRLGQD